MLTFALSLLFGLAIGGAVLTLLLGLRGHGEVQAAEQERMYAIGAAFTLEEVELSRPLQERVLKPIFSSVLAFLARFSPQANLQDLHHRLELAGRPNNWSAVDLVGVRVLAAFLMAAMAMVLLLLSDLPLVRRILLSAVCGLLGYYLPLVWLNSRVRKRQLALVKALPDGLDMLNVCVSAGLGFDAALSRVGERWDTPLADEFNRVVTEIRLGKVRREALQAMVARTGVTEIENFVATVVQADQLGVSIAKVLRTQAEQMRTLRRQRAEEMARQATIKLLFPLVFLIFPAMLAVLLGPAVPQLLSTFGRLGM
ncbi:MAG TPA: type II secretion system F family protein [Anaerolineae bacterium]|nr:type II secretion system F family protein [Anaerolineae bacterium]